MVRACGRKSFTFRLDNARHFEVEIFEGGELRGLVFFRLEECMQEWSLTGLLNAYFTVEPHGQLHLELGFSMAAHMRGGMKMRK